MYGNIDVEATGSVICIIISMPIWSFGRVLVFVFLEILPRETRGVVSRGICGEQEVSIVASQDQAGLKTLRGQVVDEGTSDGWTTRHYCRLMNRFHKSRNKMFQEYPLSIEHRVDQPPEIRQNSTISILGYQYGCTVS